MTENNDDRFYVGEVYRQTEFVDGKKVDVRFGLDSRPGFSGITTVKDVAELAKNVLSLNKRMHFMTYSNREGTEIAIIRGVKDSPPTVCIRDGLNPAQLEELAIELSSRIAVPSRTDE